MRILNIVLDGYKMFGLSNINRLTADFTAPLQLISGSNGSGKSSLLRQLTPMPAVSSDFLPGSYKSITIEHNDSTYVLMTEFHKSAEHFFIKDDEELNKGHTAMVQKELVEQELGFTPDLQKILTGRSKFTQMSPAAIMKLLMDVSNLNLDYAIGLYETAKEQARDASGAAKHIQTKLSDVISRLASFSNIDELKEREIEIRERSKKLLSLTDFQIDLDKSQEELKSIIAETENTFRKVKMIDGQLSNYGIDIGNGDLTTLIESTESSLQEYKTKFEINMTEMKKVHDTLDRFKNMPKSGDLEQILASIASISSRLKELENVDLSIQPDADHDIKVMEDIRYTLNGLRNEQADRPIRIWTTEEINSVNSNYDDLMTKKEKLLTDIRRCKGLIERADAAKDESHKCDGCGKVHYAPGALDEVRYEQIHLTIKESSKAVNVLEDLIAGEISKKESIDHFTEVLKGLKYKWLRWGDLAMDIGLMPAMMLKSPQEALELVEDRIKYLTAVNEAFDLKNKLTQLEEVRLLVESSDITGLTRRENELAIILEDINDDIRQTSESLTSLKSVKQRLDNLNEGARHANSLNAKFEEKYKEVFDAYLCNIANDEYKRATEQLSAIHSTLSSYENLIGLHDDLTNDSANLLAEKETLDILMSELSPRTGIISQQMRIFMESFFGEINKVLGKIFEYQIEVLPSKGGVNLDYKFPLIVEGKECGDITQASEGQKEVINLAFSLTLMKVMGLIEYPLYLDEIGATFDDRHRENLVGFIKNLLESKQISQIFMISHYAEVTGGLVNNETIVLHADNLTVVPSNANQHAILE